MKRLCLTLAVCCASFLGAMAQELDLMQVVANDDQVRTGTLEGGSRYYIRSNKKDAQRANFHILYDVGSIQEEDRQDGLAHFLEHMAFNGSKNFPDNSMIDYLQSIGVAFGENLNAGTSQQYTTYMITNVPITREGIVDSVLLVLHDWAGFISLNGDDIDKERGVIQEEWRMTNGSAGRRVYQKESAALFGEDNLYARRSVIGTMENLKAFTYQDIRDFYTQWYRPDLQTFMIVGDFAVDQMEAKLRSMMADIKAPEVKTPKNRVTVADNAEPRFAVTTDPELTKTEISINYRLRPIAEKYNNTVMKFKTSIINKLAFTMFNERLNNITKSADAPFQHASGYVMEYFEPFDLLSFSATSRDGEADKAYVALYTEVLRASRGGFVQAEFDRAKSNLEAMVEESYNNRNDRRNGEFVDLFSSNFIDNTPYPSAEDEYKLSKAVLCGATLDEVNAQLSSMITPTNNVITLSAQIKDGVTIPTADELAATYAAINASTIEPYKEDVVIRPLLDASKLRGSKVSKTTAGKFDATEWVLKNGIKVVVKPTTFKADEIILRASKLGGHSTISSLEDLYSIQLWNSFKEMAGLGDFSDTELRRVLTGKTAQLSPFANKLSIGYQGQSTVKDFETMLQLMYMYATDARWELADWGVLMDKLKTYVKGEENDPMRIFRDSMDMTQYGHDPRQAPLSDKMLSMVSMERMRAVYQKMFASVDGMTFTITGSVDMDSIRPLVEKYIGSMPVAKKATKAVVGPYLSQFAKGRIVNRFVTKQETPRVIAVTLYNGDIENYSLSKNINLKAVGEVLNIVYLKSIREDKGGTYVMQNMMDVMTDPKPMAVDFALFMTDTSKIEELLPLIDTGIMNICAKGPSTENLTKVTENFAKKFAEINVENSTWSKYLNAWYTFDRDNYTTYLQDLQGVTVESVRQAAISLFDQKNQITLVQLP